VPVLVLQHVAVEGPGRVGHALARAGRTLDLRRLDQGAPLPTTAADVEAVVVMGGPMGLADLETVPHLRAELRLLEDALARHRPVLGICLGSQLLATAAGGLVRPGPSLELGWAPLVRTDAGRRDPVLSRLDDPLAVLHWHRDVIELPAQATHLASSAQTAVQAFVVGDAAYGLLFHLEADAAHVAGMADAFPDEVAAAGLTAAALSADPAIAALAEAADAALDAWVRLIPS
jgi:GMP synthase-like glutamine amidotransferase